MRLFVVVRSVLFVRVACLSLLFAVVWRGMCSFVVGCSLLLFCASIIRRCGLLLLLCVVCSS